MSKPIEIDLTNQGDRAPAFGTALSSADADQAASRLAPDGLQSTGAARWLAVCSNRPRPSLQNNHSRGSQWWRRDVWHIVGRDGRTLCGRDSSDWLTIGVVEMSADCCSRCAAKAAAQ